MMLITLSNRVIVRPFLVPDGGSGAGGSGGSACFPSAMMLCASIRSFFCFSRAILVLSAIALPAATRFGFFVLSLELLKSLVLRPVDQQAVVYLPYIC